MPQILVVGKHADAGDSVARALGSDFELRRIASAKEALDAIRAGHPGLVIVEVIAPGLDGFAVLHAIRVDAVHLPVHAGNAPQSGAGGRPCRPHYTPRQHQKADSVRHEEAHRQAWLSGPSTGRQRHATTWKASLSSLPPAVTSKTHSPFLSVLLRAWIHWQRCLSAGALYRKCISRAVIHDGSWLLWVQHDRCFCSDGSPLVCT